MTIRMALIVAAAHAALKAQAARINALNVYPVPDGDTGTNMLLTLESILKEAKSRSYENVEAAVKAGARAALMGARGNSGVILSQMIRGGCDVLALRTTFTAEDFVEALEGAQERAYASTRKPVEGTMLTVMKDAAVAARAALSGVGGKGVDLPSVVRIAAQEAHASVKRTPQKLAVLKEAGVVDAGGLGVAVILDGLYAVISGKEPEPYDTDDGSEEGVITPDLDAIHAGEEAWGYCTEFIVTGFSGDAGEFEQHVLGVGESVLVISDDDLVKVHLHTQDPGSVMSYAGQFGRLTGVKVDDMEAQVDARIEPKGASGSHVQKGTVAVVAASRGRGNRRLFEEFGAFVIEGGQGANPSAQDFAEAVEEVVRLSGAKEVLLLPNNKNIIPTAGQVSELVGVGVTVVPTKTLVGGLSVMVAFDAAGDAEAVAEEMEETLEELETVEITRAVRDATLDGREIAEGSYIALLNGKLCAVGKTVGEVAVEAAGAMLDSGADLVTLLRGEDLRDEDLDEVVARIEALDGDVEVEVRDGGQPLYPLQMAAE